MERKHWIDNLRWATVLLVLFYHVVYFYNNKGVFGGIGGFGEYPQCKQYQDIVLYVLYPFFMPLLFLLAGIGARYALQKQPGREWIKSRTRKLLVPSTIGLFVFQWMTGYFNSMKPLLVGENMADGLPAIAKYVVWSLTGMGPLWFVQVLWLLCLLLLLVRALDCKDKFYNFCGKANYLAIIILGVLFWLGEQTLIMNPRPESLDGLVNLYKPLFYLIPFLLGYFVFAHDEVQDKLEKAWIPLMACAVAVGTVLIFNTFGQDYTSPQYLGSPLNCLYGWLMCLAMMGWFKAKFNRTGAFAGYMTRSSFGIYVVHYLVVVSVGYMLKHHTSLVPWLIYVVLFLAVMLLSPAIYELLRRIPFVRWCVLGERKR